MKAMVYFADGTAAEIDNVRGHDPRVFTIPPGREFAFAQQFTKGSDIRFSEAGERYLMKSMRGSEVTAVLAVKRR